MRYLIILLILSLCYMQPALATHNRAGYITYEQIGERTFRCTLITYTSIKPGVIADRPQLTLQWGDNTSSLVDRSDKLDLPNFYRRNTYVGVHTYPGQGVYQVTMEDPNRNEGVVNIPGSVDIKFAVKTVLQINSSIGLNSTPIMLTPPYDRAVKGQLFIHNPGAYDKDGDSLSYKLTRCLGDNGKAITEFRYPVATKYLRVDSINGDLIWNAPAEVGIYNIAMLIDEWRNGVNISTVERDMQIEVYESPNKPPVIDPIPDQCVVAGEEVSFAVSATDPAGLDVGLLSYGGVYLLTPNPANFKVTEANHGFVKGIFDWKTKLLDVRKEPYQVEFKAENNFVDQYGSFPLVDFKSAKITVVAPAPKNPTLSPSTNTMTFVWDKEVSPKAVGYYIYRKVNPSMYKPDHCTRGIPQYAGYELIAKTNSINDTIYEDSNNGTSLWQGVDYCYRVTAVFPDGCESLPSDEVCATLIRGLPAITHVSIRTTDKVNGSVYLAWAKPTNFDNVKEPGPYQYDIYRATNLWGRGANKIATIDGIDNTVFIDTLLNTADQPVSYYITFMNNTPGKYHAIGTAQRASSVFVDIVPENQRLNLKLNYSVPWTDSSFVVYRQDPGKSNFDSIGITHSDKYVDYNLINGQTYCYKVKSYGYYSVPDIKNPLINWSQIRCGTPLDTIPPCPPITVVNSDCAADVNTVTWTINTLNCTEDAAKYNIYFSPTLDGELKLVASRKPTDGFTYLHRPSTGLAGCYLVASVDSAGNESSKKTGKACVDVCDDYKLPNVFTPNGDGVNDYFTPFPFKYVEKIEMKIYNRWGVLVFETTDPNIKWDGKDINSKKLVSDGVYYYVCNVYEYRLSGLTPRYLVGFIQVLDGKDKSTN